MFKELKGIEKEREEKERDNSTVEYLLETCDEVIQEYKTKITEYYTEIHEVYQAMHKKIEKKLPEYNQQDLTSLIFAKANKEYDKKESAALGLYTGILLHILTKRNSKKGKKTQFYINGRGNKFDYLFYFAKEVDELTIESFTGDNICDSIASYEGKANKITLNNNKGNDTAWNAGGNQGNIKTLIINNNKGNQTAQYAGSDQGNIKTLIINNNKGNNTAYHAGSFQGNINTLIINNNKGNQTAWNAGYTGNINKIIINNSKGKNIAECAEAKQIITGEEALQEYQEIIQLLNSFKNKTPKEIITITEEITKCLNNSKE